MRILFLTHRLPYAPNRGDRIRAYHILRTVAQHADVELVSLVHDREEQAHAANLRDWIHDVTTVLVPRMRNARRALTELRGNRPLTHTLLDAPSMHAELTRIMAIRPPDVVFAYCSGMARFALEPPLARVPFVLDMVDVDSEKWAAFARISSVPQRWIYGREAESLARFEAVAVHAAHATLVVNERERASLIRAVPGTNVHVVPIGVDVAALRPIQGPATSARVVFCGVMNYLPNKEAALWLARDVWPLVRERRSDARLILVGSNPPRAIRALAARDGSIEVTGSVSDVRPFLWQSTVSVAPLSVARGVQSKVLEAVAAGLPAVITSAVAGGLPDEVAGACVVADTAEAFATAVLNLLGLSPAERRAMAERADLGSFDWPRRLAPLFEILEAAAQQKKSSYPEPKFCETADSRALQSSI